MVRGYSTGLPLGFRLLPLGFRLLPLGFCV
jgi:hypothetical protein